MDVDSVRTPRRNPTKNSLATHTRVNNRSSNLGARLSNALPAERQEFEKKLMLQAVDLISRGKVSAKNAFDMPTGFTDIIPIFVKKSAENAWVEVSQGLDASAKIYGYRVDALHIDTYKIRGELYRNVRDQEQAEETVKGETRKRHKDFAEGEKTLEAESTLLADKYDTEITCDPLFRKATAKFDERGAKGLTQNISRLSSQNLEILFYTGTACELPKDTTMPLLDVEYEKQIQSIFQETLTKTSIESITDLKMNDPLIEYKHERLGIPYLPSDITPLSDPQGLGTQCTKNEDKKKQKIINRNKKQKILLMRRR